MANNGRSIYGDITSVNHKSKRIKGKRTPVTKIGFTQDYRPGEQRYEFFGKCELSDKHKGCRIIMSEKPDGQGPMPLEQTLLVVTENGIIPMLFRKQSQPLLRSA